LRVFSGPKVTIKLSMPSFQGVNATNALCLVPDQNRLLLLQLVRSSGDAHTLCSSFFDE